MTTLAEFLLQQVANDEYLASLHGDAEMACLPGSPPAWWQKVAARVPAECAAKRAIVELHSQDEHDCVEIHRGVYPADWPTEAAWGKAGEPWAHPSLEQQFGPCPTLRHLAAPYADHESFDPRWRIGDPS